MVVYLLYWRIMDIQWKLNVEWSRTARIMEVMERDMETERARMVREGDTPVYSRVKKVKRQG